MAPSADDMNRRLISAAELDAYKEAFKQEFKQAAESDDPENMKKVVRKKFAEALMMVADDFVEIAHTSSSDPARISAGKFIFEFFFGNDAKSGSHGSLEDMLAELKES